MKTSLKWGRNSHQSPSNPESPKQVKPKVKHPKTHINQINKDQTQRTNIKSSKGKKRITHKGIPIRITADLSIEILQVRKEWQDMLTVMKENNYRLLYPARVSFKYEGVIKSFTDKQKLREFRTTKPALQQMLRIFSRQETQKTCINSNSKQEKMAMGSYVSIITLNVSGLNAPIKRQRLAEWIQKQDPYI